VATLNIVYGIGALHDANIFVNDKRYIFSNLTTMDWVLIVVGVIQLTGGFSLFAGPGGRPGARPFSPARSRRGWRACRSPGLI